MDDLCPRREGLESRIFRGLSYLEVIKNFQQRMKDLRRREPYIKDIKIEHECVFNRFLSSEESRDFNESLLGNHVYCPRLVPRETMTSGRKELLRFLWTKTWTKVYL